jgi:cyclomaltodextrinase
MNKYSFIFLLFILLSLGSVFAINSSFLLSKDASSVYLVASFNNFEPVEMERHLVKNL